MLSFIINLLIISGAMSLVAAALLMAKKPLKGFSASCRYLLWLLVIIRLCLPFSLTPELVDISFNENEKSIPVEVKEISSVAIPDPVYSVDFAAVSEEKIFNTATEAAPASRAEQADTVISEAKETNMPATELAGYIAFGTWLLGALLFFGVSMLRYFKNIRILNFSLVPANNRTFECWLEVCGEMGVKRIPEICFSYCVKTPMLYGFFKPKVILPEIDIAEADLKGILRHELTHYKRGDLFVKFLAMTANALHWFNPMAYIASTGLSNEMELSCDEKVLCGLCREERISYGAAMLEIVKKCRRSAPSLTTGFNPRRDAIKARFENILDTQKKKRGVSLVALLLCISLLATGLIGCSSNEAKPKETDIETVINAKNEEKPKNYSIFARYEGEVKDIQPLYDVMSSQMQSFGVSKLTTDKGEFLIDMNGDIRAELPESELSYDYCSVCGYITDHINFVDPFTFEVDSALLGHGGGSSYYIYDSEEGNIYKSTLSEYVLCENIDFAVVSQALPNDTYEAVYEEYEISEDIDGSSSSISVYRPGNYYGQTGKFALVCKGELASDFIYDGYLNFDNYGFCALRKEGKWGYYNHRGEMILEHLYDDAGIIKNWDHPEMTPYSVSSGLIALNKEGKWGYADTEGNIITDFEFEEARPVANRRAWVKDEKGWMLIEFNIEEELYTAEALELADEYLDNFYYSEPKPEWKFVYNGEAAYYATPCYSFDARVYGEAHSNDIYEVYVCMNKSIYKANHSASTSVYIGEE